MLERRCRGLARPSAVTIVSVEKGSVIIRYKKNWLSLSKTKTLYVPKDAYSIIPLAKTIAISTEKGSRLDQVIEGFDIRLLLHTNLKSNSSDDTLLVAMRGTRTTRTESVTKQQN